MAKNLTCKTSFRVLQEVPLPFFTGSQWILPRKARKAGKVGVGGVEHQAAFDRQRREVSVGRQVSGCPRLQEE